MAGVTPLRLTVVALTLAVAAAAALWVVTYRVPEPYVGPALAPSSSYFYLPSYSSPAWTTPVAVLMGTAAVGAAVLVLRRSR